MPTAACISVADAVVALLTPIAASNSGTCERSWVPVRDLEEAETLLISVVPGVGPSPPETRTSWQRNYKVGVAVQQRMPLDLADDAARLAWIDSRVLLVEQLQTAIEDAGRLTVDAGASFPLDAAIKQAEIDNLFLPDELDEDKIFAAELFVSCRAIREMGE